MIFIASPAVAATPTDEPRPGALEVSRDGISWSTSYPGELFATGLDLAPGGSAAATVHVRNATTADATVGARVIEVADGPAAAHAELSVTIDGGPSTRRTLAAWRATSANPNTATLAAGEAARVDVGIELPLATPNSAQRSPLSFVLVVDLAGESVQLPTAPPVPPPGDAPGGSLPSTGAVVTRSLAVAAALALLGLGIRQLAHRRLGDG